MFRCAVRVRRIHRIERAPESRDSLLFRLECLSFGTLQVWVLFMHDTRIQVLQDTRSTRVHIPELRAGADATVLPGHLWPDELPREVRKTIF